MEPGNAHAPKESRPPTFNDLIEVCRALNNAGARFVVVGGMAMIHHGFVRATEDVDLLIDATPQNVERVKRALAAALPDHAALEVHDSDVEKYTVVRVADEIVVDLMKNACGIDYDQGSKDIVWADFRGVRVPFASARMLWKMKQTVREKDKPDRMFLKTLLERSE